MLLSICNIRAQNDSVPITKAVSKNAVYYELLGNGYLNQEHWLGWIDYTMGTINYERKVNKWCAIRVGFTGNKNNISIPILFNIISNPNGTHHADNGIGVVFLHSENNDAYYIHNDIAITLSFKYRYQKGRRGLFFAFGYTPGVFIQNYYFDTFFPLQSQYLFRLLSGGCSIGYHF